MKGNYLFIVIIIVTFIITLGGVIAYESSNDESVINMISQSLTPDSYTKFHDLEFKIPKGFNVTKNNSKDLIMVTKGAYFRDVGSTYSGFELPKNKGISAISITYLSKNDFSNSNNNSINNSSDFNSTYSNSSSYNYNNYNSTSHDSTNSLSSNLNNSNYNNLNTSDRQNMDNISSNNSNNSSNVSSSDSNKIDFTKISVSNPSNNLTVDGVTIFRMNKDGVKSYIFSYENGLYAVSLYSANITNSSETDEIFESIVDRTFKK